MSQLAFATFATTVMVTYLVTYMKWGCQFLLKNRKIPPLLRFTWKVIKKTFRQFWIQWKRYFQVFKGVLIDCNYVLNQFWGHIQTQGTWLPQEQSSGSFYIELVKNTNILLLHANISGWVGTFLDPISKSGLVTHHDWCYSNVSQIHSNKTTHRFFLN